ncbi:MAG: LptF/LptG family permease, partial [Bacteroides sp.]|nr:LptF/LptG family permease [Bacteroides sp.]
LYTLLISMKHKSPELDIPEGAFYDEIDGYSIYVKKKDRKTGALYNIMIYDLSDGFENAHIIVADTGYMESTVDKKHLYLHLYNGELFENIKPQTVGTGGNNVPYRRETFREKHSLIEFDADFNMIDGSFLSSQSLSKNMQGLQQSIDSMSVRNDSVGRSYFEDAKAGTFKLDLSREDSTKVSRDSTVHSVNVDSLFKRSSLQKKQTYLSGAVTRLDNTGHDWQFKSHTLSETDRDIRRHGLEWHKKITLSLSCLIFFFIGAPLGSIIRKGGLGMPVIISIVIFIIYYIIDNTGYKMGRDDNWQVWLGMWISSIILIPLGAFFTYKSNNDSVVFNADLYKGWFNKILGRRSVRHLYRKEVIINDPDYPAVICKMEALTRECESYLAKKRLKKAPNYFKLWMNTSVDREIEQVNEKLEEIVEELSNSQSHLILKEVNNYPVIPPHAHVRPFRNYWLNILTGLILPVGIFFYLRIWIFRLRLYKDLRMVITTNKNMEIIIEQENHKENI